MKKCLVTLVIILICQVSFAQEFNFHLSEVILLAKDNSLAAQQARSRKKNKYWDYRTFTPRFKPKISLTTTLPEYSRTKAYDIQNDTLSSTVTQNINTFSKLNIYQEIPQTGGSIYMSTSLNRYQLIESAPSFAGDVFEFGFNQRLFGFNAMKWDQKIIPMKYQEALKKYAEELEYVSYSSTQLFFNLLISQINLDIAGKNYRSNQLIYAQKKDELNEDELLQMEINVMTAQRDYATAKLESEKAMITLNNYLGLPKNDQITLYVPDEIPNFSVPPEEAITQAKRNREKYLAFTRRRLEAERNVKQARADVRPNINLGASVRFYNNAEHVDDMYYAPDAFQKVNLSLTIPIVDWGERKAKLQRAISSQELTESSIKQEELDFTQQVYILAKQIPILRTKVRISKKTEERAERRFQVAKEQYLNSEISVTDWNFAQNSKDVAKRNYLYALKEFWVAYYQLRMLTLYDFERNEKIAAS
ncbi:TolC family protein [Sediminitomix flava]|uniref:Outer membrane efflux protein n=1 Tax=Sediminitomix flava TaxID=379075 RepID=A0A315Z5F2_SEDFL|nr:TolC family protein [Sediminitomix flava]PWJ38429.1 outer membrane efflux protein [Sediminitomix flava]